ncbi:MULTISPECIES: hypothetical protein [Streptomyces]|uniref:Uncharacterized protein n=1 Tax=Streptomyces changanensis TaxID=2964669 RepID=A0ABY5N6B4_9ACTN|nr:MULTISPECIES: hypothetical protein [Streptomyces]UUS32070.1 hypothetical protein NRO40_15420 [Streptomyces changanensis]
MVLTAGNRPFLPGAPPVLPLPGAAGAMDEAGALGHRDGASAGGLSPASGAS